MGGTITYVGYYDRPSNSMEGRCYVLSATNKMDYIIHTLNGLGLRVNVVSASVTRHSRGYAGSISGLDAGNTLIRFRTLPWGGKVRRIASVVWGQWMLFLWLMNGLRTGDDVIVYHSLGYARLLTLARRLRRFRLILEVEEVYADVTGRRADRRKEMSLFQRADAFIFPTELLDGQLNRDKKPHVVVHGTYRVEPVSESDRSDDRIHVVYAGTFDPRKGGALAAAAAAEYLDARYHVHIIGSGTKSDTDSLLGLIEEVSARTECRLTYDGLLAGEDYIRFLQSCDVGLSTQRPDAAFNDTSFPSKVLSYMANGLRVVSIRIKALEQSKVSDLLYYYDSDNPAALAAAIQAVDLSAPYDSRERIRRLDDEFCAALGELISQ